jgi:hypothetical protein
MQFSDRTKEIVFFSIESVIESLAASDRMSLQKCDEKSRSDLFWLLCSRAQLEEYSRSSRRWSRISTLFILARCDHDFLRWDKWWILRQSSFDLETSSSENEMKNSRTLFICAILFLSTWLFTSFVIMSKASLTKMRFSLKINWEELMYSIFTSHWIMSRMTRVYVKSE